MPKEKLKHLDLFAGIGGFTLAGEWSGLTETIGFSEIDPYASAVLNKNFPTIKNYGDIRQITRETLGSRIDLITGGFPCQPFSTAGKRKGKADNRDLWPEMLRVIKEFRPSWVVGENVAGFVNMELDRTLADLEAEGYSTRAFIIPACAIDACHRRDRVWIVANARCQSEGRESQRLGSERLNCAAEGQRTEAGDRPANEDSHASNTYGSFIKGEWIPCGSYEKHAILNSYNWHEAATSICGKDDGLPNRAHRLKCLGNSIVPQIPQIIFSYIKEIEGI